MAPAQQFFENRITPEFPKFWDLNQASPSPGRLVLPVRNVLPFRRKCFMFPRLHYQDRVRFPKPELETVCSCQIATIHDF